MPVISLDTNLNGKIGNDFMVHIMQAASRAITEQTFAVPATFKLPDGTSVDYLMWDYVKDEVRKIPLHLVMSSHGTMDRNEFIQRMYEEHGLAPDEKAGVFFFMKSEKK